MGELPQNNYGSLTKEDLDNMEGWENFPIYYTLWFNALAYCNALSAKEGLTPAYTINGDNTVWNKSANGYRLPTEAEWEYACRAGTTTNYYWGDTYMPGKGNFVADDNGIIPVKSFPPNPWGLYDMAGNVSEWCWDWYTDYLGTSAVTDPSGPADGYVLRVVRGGTWPINASSVRSASRGNAPSGYSFDYVGFRVCRSAL
jgi:formylglycine-generating enzyme required for sulfatase activity